jgi:hypothetical protein
LDAVNGWGAALDLTADGSAGPEVRLAPCGSARVRLVNDRGQLLAGRKLLLLLLTERSFPAASPPLQREADRHADYWYDPLHYAENRTSDAEGWLTLPALIPGARYVLQYTDVEGVFRHTPEFRVEPGEQLQLPELAIQDEARKKAVEQPSGERPPLGCLENPTSRKGRNTDVDEQQSATKEDGLHPD